MASKLTTLSRQHSITPKPSLPVKRPRSSPSTSPSAPSPPEKRTCAYFAKTSDTPHQIPVKRHEGAKHTWALPAIKKPLLVIGDSNLSRISSSPTEAIQIESFSGAQFHHINKILKNCEQTEKPDKIIISIGINNRKSNTGTTSLPEFRNMINQAKKCFPNSELYIPIINFSDHLEEKEKENLATLNEFLADQPKAITIPPLSSNHFKVGYDAIHWTTQTANAMVKHWLGHLN